MIVRLLFVFVSDFFFFLIDWSSRPLDLPNRFCQFPKKNQQKKQKQKPDGSRCRRPEMVRFSFVFFWNVVTVISSLLFPSIIDVHLEFGTIHVEQRKKNSNFFWKRTLPRPKVKKKKNKKKTANKKQQQQQQQQQKESLTDVPLLNDRYIGLEDVDVVVVFQRCDVTAPAAAAAANGVWVCSFCFVFFVDIFFKKSIFLA